MWWAKGFPGRIADAPWLRIVQTGHYALALNTETLQIPHFGKSTFKDDWNKLPPAQLDLELSVDGKTYKAKTGGKWSRYTGPRIVDSGRFFQRGDVTDLDFVSEDGQHLNAETRLETAAWADRLSLSLWSRPGLRPIASGDTFGRIGGGYGLDGDNHFEPPQNKEIDREQFTIEFWTYVPHNHCASANGVAWLMCMNSNEHADGNVGITLGNSQAIARINIGGGQANAFQIKPDASHALKLGEWNHLAVSYDGETFSLYVNGNTAGGTKVSKQRTPGRGALVFGRRQDNFGDGYHFRGVVDEIRVYGRALTPEELRLRRAKPEMPTPDCHTIAEWSFNPDGPSFTAQAPEVWRQFASEIKLSTPSANLKQRNAKSSDKPDADRVWNEVALLMEPSTMKSLTPTHPVQIAATDLGTGAPRPVVFDPVPGWHRINLDGIEPTAPPGGNNPSNDSIERVRVTLNNPTAMEQVARLMFEKVWQGIRQRIGSPITGVSAVLRDAEGNPTGIPVQLSKNWHNEAVGGTYAGCWFHGISQVRLPANAALELELTLCYGHWGGVPAASHSQLSLIGWGSNQLWEQSALGAWGESVCYEPDQVQANCTITDVRPVMVRSVGKGAPWGWTQNVGGGDVLRFFSLEGIRVAHSEMQTTFHRQGPCLSEVTHAGRLGATITHSDTVSLARTDDIVRTVHRLRFEATDITPFSRFVLFQIGADTYNSSQIHKLAVGSEAGLSKEWVAQPGRNTAPPPPVEGLGATPWVSLHEAVVKGPQEGGATANRGIIIRSWKARLGGKPAAPWFAEHGITIHKDESTTVDIVPPPGLKRLEPGDFVDATIEFVVLPQFARDYYGPNTPLREALVRDENTWRMVHREAVGNARNVEIKHGRLQGTHPAVAVKVDRGIAELTISRGMGYVPLVFSGLSSPIAGELLLDGQLVNQSVHGKDFWQTDFDPATKTWSQTFNLPIAGTEPHLIQFSSTP